MIIAHEVANKIISFKEAYAKNKAAVIAIEGLSCSGKSTLSKKLSEIIEAKGHSSSVIEGDKFHVGYNPAMEMYQKIISEVMKGRSVPDNFPSLIWNLDMLKEQTLDKILEFNRSERESSTLELNDVLTGKKIGSEHNEIYTLDRGKIFLVPSMYLRQIEGFDYSIFLEISPEISVERKIERTRKKGYERDIILTRNMVELVEYPAMVNHNNSAGDPNLTIDMNDFFDMRIESETVSRNDKHE